MDRELDCAYDNVYVWIYALDTTLQQYTVIHNIYDDFRYIHGLGIQGVFWQCQYDGLGIQRVEHQLLAELNWNMDMTEEEFEELLCRILEKEYGDRVVVYQRLHRHMAEIAADSRLLAVLGLDLSGPVGYKVQHGLLCA